MTECCIILATGDNLIHVCGLPPPECGTITKPWIQLHTVTELSCTHEPAFLIDSAQVWTAYRLLCL